MIVRSTVGLCCLAVIAVAAPSSSRAGEEDAAARRLFAEGLAHADAARWSEASDCFTRAYALRPSPPIAYNLSIALAHGGQLVRASELLTGITADGDARSDVRDAARARLGELEPRLAHLTVNASAADRRHLWLDGRAVDPAASAAPIALDPGEHLLELRPGSGRAVSRRVALREGGAETVSFDHVPVPTPARLDLRAPPPPPPVSVLRKPWLWGLVGAAVLASGAAFLATRGHGAPPTRGNVDTWDLSR